VALTVLSVAYPMAPVKPDAVGGAEQVLSRLDHALVEAGHRSLVIACEGSQVRGELLAVPFAAGAFDPMQIMASRTSHRRAIDQALARWPIDLIHFHGIDFDSYLPAPGVPVLVTLHLPIPWYSPAALAPIRPKTWLNCVSWSQHRSCGAHPCLLPPIENGVPVGEGVPLTKRTFALMLTRICPEKGVHLAIDAAKRAGVPLLIAGALFPYEAHQRYFAAEIVPRLDRWRRFIGPIGGARKRRLLAAARCLLVPSLVAETSSLVAREAIAAGTPVVAFDGGAMNQTVEQDWTGFLVQDVESMAAAIGRCHEISAAACRDTARRRFCLEQMVARYFGIYDQLTRADAAERLAPAVA
jgi:glycosyltransferase involved in cell wall biosynthesis